MDEFVWCFSLDVFYFSSYLGFRSSDDDGRPRAHPDHSQYSADLPPGQDIVGDEAGGGVPQGDVVGHSERS